MTDSTHEPRDEEAALSGMRDRLRRNWSLLLALGILLMVGGIAAIVLPVVASLAVTVVVGLTMLVGGVFQGIHAFRCGGWRCRGWSLLSAALYLVGSVLLLLDPLARLIALTVVVIALIGADGVLRIVIATRLRPERGWGWMLFGGMAGVVLALVMLVLLPMISLTALGILVGVAFLFEGWGFAYLALASRDASGTQRAAAS